jgi:hypothetical protein
MGCKTWGVHYKYLGMGSQELVAQRGSGILLPPAGLVLVQMGLQYRVSGTAVLLLPLLLASSLPGDFSRRGSQAADVGDTIIS